MHSRELPLVGNAKKRSKKKKKKNEVGGCGLMACAPVRGRGFFFFLAPLGPTGGGTGDWWLVAGGWWLVAGGWWTGGTRNCCCH
jgi:hypothetical protein